MAAKTLERIKLSIYGYLREFEHKNKLSNRFPNELKSVIVLFYPRDKIKFIDLGIENECKIVNDGATLIYSRIDTVWTTCQIGEFFDSKQKLIHTITLKCYSHGSGDMITGANGIGFISKEYNAFIAPRWNHGNNGSTAIASNGFFITSKCFDEEMKNHFEFIESHENAIPDHGCWYIDNDLLMIKIDTYKMKAIVWNSTPPKGTVKAKTDLNVDEEYEDYVGFYFKFDLPKDISVALQMELGTAQTVEIVDHVIVYK